MRRFRTWTPMLLLLALLPVLIAAQNGGDPGIGAPFDELFAYVVGIGASLITSLLSVWQKGKAFYDKEAGEPTILGKGLKALQPVLVWLISLGLGWAATNVGLDAALGSQCLVEGVAGSCDAFAMATSSTFIGILFYELIGKRLGGMIKDR